MQGENDRHNLAWATDYQANLETLMPQLRNKLGDSQAPMVIVRTNAAITTPAYVALVQRGQTAFVTGDSKARLVGGDDLALLDGIHYDPVSIGILGSRIAGRFMQMHNE